MTPTPNSPAPARQGTEKPTVQLAEIRRLIADYIGSEGCECCRGSDHDEHQAAIAKLLKVPKYRDGSGYDFSKFKSKLKANPHA